MLGKPRILIRDAHSTESYQLRPDADSFKHDLDEGPTFNLYSTLRHALVMRFVCHGWRD